MRYFEVEGASPAEILNQFTLQENIPKEYVKMEILDEGTKGFLGLGKKPAKVKIVFDDYEYLKRKAKLYLSEILEHSGFDSYIEVKEMRPTVTLNILSEDSNLLIGKSATMLDSLQYLVDRVTRPMDTDVSILVDVDNYRERVVEPTKQKALKLAQSVRKTGRPAKLPPMVTFVRREVHMAAKSVPDVTTISHGDGQVKSVTIISEKKTRQDDTKRPNHNRQNNRRPRPDRGKTEK